jgi:type III secretion system (T3SS) SseB-like protein
VSTHESMPGGSEPTGATGSPGSNDPSPGLSLAPEDIAGPDELAEVLTLSRESGDGSLLMRTLVRASLCVPLPPEMGGIEPGRRQLEPGSELALPLIENEGTNYVVAFTSEERMTDWFPDDNRPVWHESLLADLLQGWPDDAGLALDASSEGGVLLPAAVIERLKLLASGAPVEEVFDLGPATRFRAGTPIDPPTDVLDALRGVAENTPGVRRVTMLLVQIDEPNGRTWPVVGVLFDDGIDPESPLTAMVNAVEQVTDEHVSFTALPAVEGSEFERVLRDDGLVVL